MCSSTSFSHSPISQGCATQRTLALRSRMRTLNSWKVPPYTWAEETKLTSSAPWAGRTSRGSIACLIAAMPEAVHRAEASTAQP